VLRLTFATSRSTVSPLRRPRPVSTTSVAREPTTIPMFGTSGTLPSGIAYVCGPSITVTPSRTSGSGAGPRCAHVDAVAATSTTNSVEPSLAAIAGQSTR
jgi:hypothetical protein